MSEQAIEVIPTDRRSLRRVENSGRIYDAAMQLLAKRPYDEVSVDDICAAAGVGRRTFFRIYKSKGALIKEFNRRLAEQVMVRLQEEGTGQFAHSLMLVGEEIANVWTKTPKSAAALAMDYTRGNAASRLHAGHPELLDIVTDLVEYGIREGEVQTTLPSSFVGSLALLQITSTAFYWFQDTEQDLYAMIEETINNFLHGVIKS